MRKSCIRISERGDGRRRGMIFGGGWSSSTYLVLAMTTSVVSAARRFLVLLTVLAVAVVVEAVRTASNTSKLPNPLPVIFHRIIPPQFSPLLQLLLLQRSKLPSHTCISKFDLMTLCFLYNIHSKSLPPSQTGISTNFLPFHATRA